MKNFQLFFVLLTTLTLGVTNAWAEEVTMTAGTNGSACTVNDIAGIKVGTSKAGGDMTITVPKGATSLQLYAAAWKGVTDLSINITPESNVNPTSISLTADKGINANSPFTLEGDAESFKHEVTLSNITSETTLTLTSSTAERFVVWGATCTVAGGENPGEGGGEDPVDPNPGTGSSTGWVETAIGNITSSDIVVVTMTNSDGTYAMSNDNGTSDAPTAVEVIVNGDKLSEEPADNLKWNITNSSGSLTIYPNGSTSTWLYCTNKNDGTRVGTNTSKTFTIDATSGYLKHTGTTRYLGVYSSQDWRCYTSATAKNIANQTLKFYKYVKQSSEGGGSGEPLPSLTANPTSLNFGTKNIYLESEKQGSLEIEITGQNLTGNVTAALSGTDASVFTLSASSFTPNAGSVSETLTVSYEVLEEKEYSATLTLSSDGVDPIELPITLTTVNKKPTIYTKVTDAATLSAGDKVIFVYETGKVAAGKLSGGYLASIDIAQAINTTTNPATVSITDEAVVEYTLGGTTGAWELISASGKLSEANANSTKSVDLAVNKGTNWTISISSGDATIKGTTNTIQ